MSPDRGRQLWLVPVVLVAVIVTAIGGLLARQLYSAEPGAGEVVVSPQTTVQPSEQPGSHVVGGTADATAHPLFESVREVLQTYFDAINRRDYETWRRTVTQERIDTEPEQTWLENFRSTEDGSIVVYRIELHGEDEARVLMTFTSVQEPADAPPELPVGCIHWNVVIALVLDDSDWKIDAGPTGASPQTEACA